MSPDADSQLFSDARAWADLDPDPATAASLTELVSLAEPSSS